MYAVLEGLDAGLIAHIGWTTDEGPIVLPMAYGRNDEWLYLHGSVANAALRAAVGQDICVTGHDPRRPRRRPLPRSTTR